MGARDRWIGERTLTCCGIPVLLSDSNNCMFLFLEFEFSIKCMFLILEFEFSSKTCSTCRPQTVTIAFHLPRICSFKVIVRVLPSLQGVASHSITSSLLSRQHNSYCT